MNTIKKSLIITAKNAHNRYLYLQTCEKWICQAYETFSYIKLYIILGKKTKQHK